MARPDPTHDPDPAPEAADTLGQTGAGRPGDPFKGVSVVPVDGPETEGSGADAARPQGDEVDPGAG